MKNETKQQTAVEFLIEMTSKLGYVSADIAEQAKEIHNQEIIDAWEDGHDSFSTRNAEQYYNETFNK